MQHTKDTPPIWWSNATFFVGIHIAAVYGVLYLSPLASTPVKSLLLAVALWQLSCFGITIGYHRLYSHRAFRARFGVRVTLMVLGSMAFQGSIKWWTLRHRLHHRFTDDPIHDPYAATRGLLWSHMGWIFFKPSYPRLESIDKDDLERDPVVKFQHRYYVPIALFFGLVFPAIIGYAWDDALGAFIWAGMVARIAAWHCTFLVNSLAHWEGLQKYSDEMSARGNLIMAMLTCGEGNHNFVSDHAFPHDYRAGPQLFDWDPSKWVIRMLHNLKLASRLRCARDEDISYAMKCIQRKQKTSDTWDHQPIAPSDPNSWKGPVWDRSEIKEYLKNQSGSCCLIVNDLLTDVTQYIGEHPGGSGLLRNFSLRMEDDDVVWQDATWAFENLNTHSSIARKRLQEFAIARVILGDISQDQ
ncbi:hypothetical protein M422DRAFT_25353 [Sphaerobolus stellatus SS14]|nr:hypothetical protein M422DRAFT_25353 [Sphaerobolus stellatus SS14]